MVIFNDRFYKETLKNEKPTLINKMNIHNYDKLQKAELAFSIENIFNLSENPIDGCWDYRHLAKYHNQIFGDLYEWAGAMRIFGVEKAEEVLAGASVEYADPLLIVPTADSYLTKFRQQDLTKMSLEEQTKFFCQTLVGVWQTHPFNEGNTRTVTKFMVDAARKKGLHMNFVLFGDHSDYFRRSLVVYTYGRTDYLENIVRDAINQGEQNNVSTRELPILINGFVKGRIKKEQLINKTFHFENEQYRIINLVKTKGQAQAEALIFNCDTQRTYLEKNFAGEVPFKLKLNNETQSISLQTNKNIQE